MKSDIKKLAKDLKKQLVGLYGSRFEALVLFGSYARGDFKEDSDVDFMVVLNDEIVKGSTEIAFVRKITSNLSLQYNKLISILPTTQLRFYESSLPFYNIVRNEGIRI